MINLRFYFDEYKRQLAEIRIFIQSVELQKDVISEIEFYEKQGEKEQHPYLLCFCACNGLLGSASVTFLPIISR